MPAVWRRRFDESGAKPFAMYQNKKPGGLTPGFSSHWCVKADKWPPATHDVTQSIDALPRQRKSYVAFPAVLPRSYGPRIFQSRSCPRLPKKPRRDWRNAPGPRVIAPDESSQVYPARRKPQCGKHSPVPEKYFLAASPMEMFFESVFTHSASRHRRKTSLYWFW